MFEYAAHMHIHLHLLHSPLSVSILVEEIVDDENYAAGGLYQSVNDLVPLYYHAMEVLPTCSSLHTRSHTLMHTCACAQTHLHTRTPCMHSIAHTHKRNSLPHHHHLKHCAPPHQVKNTFDEWIRKVVENLAFEDDQLRLVPLKDP